MTDICGIHNYAPWGKSLLPKYADKEKLLNGFVQKRLYEYGYSYRGEPVIMTEYGGIAFESDNPDQIAYHDRVSSEEDFLARFESLTMAIKKIPYMVGYCYTPLTDTFQEENGLLTMDRKFKVDPAKIAAINGSEADVETLAQ